MSISHNIYGKANYPKLSRKADFILIRHEQEKCCRISYWIIEVLNTDNFKVLYAYNNGLFEDNLASIEITNGKGVYRFDPEKPSINLDPSHTSDLKSKIKLYIDDVFEQAVLDA